MVKDIDVNNATLPGQSAGKGVFAPSKMVDTH